MSATRHILDLFRIALQHYLQVDLHLDFRIHPISDDERVPLIHTKRDYLPLFFSLFLCKLLIKGKQKMAAYVLAIIFEASSVMRASFEKFFATTFVLEDAATNHPTDPGVWTAPASGE